MDSEDIITRLKVDAASFRRDAETLRSGGASWSVGGVDKSSEKAADYENKSARLEEIAAAYEREAARRSE